MPVDTNPSPDLTVARRLLQAADTEIAALPHVMFQGTVSLHLKGADAHVVGAG